MKKEKCLFIADNQDNPEALHSKKISRRELLAAGAIPFAAKLFLPTSLTALGSLLATSTAEAQSLDMMSMITINLEGGAAIHGNILAMNSSYDYLPSYTYHGLGRVPNPEKYMGVYFDSRSHMLAGLKSVVSAGASGKTQIVTFCTNTAIDTRGVEPLRPQFDLAPQVEKTGRMGQYFSSLELNGQNTSLRAFHANEPKSRLSVSGLAQVTDSLSLTSVYADVISSKARFTTKQKSRLVSTLSKLTDLQLSASQSKSRYEEVGQGVVSASQELKDIVGGTVPGSQLVNPLNSPQASSVYKITTGSADLEKTKAAVVYSSLMGYASSSFMHLGGYDYHDPLSRTQSNKADFNAGVEIGRIIELAHQLQKPVYIFVATDGACFSENSDTNSSIWASDSTASLQLGIAYHPMGVKSEGKPQVGHYTTDTVVSKDTLVGDRSDYVAAAVMANYLSLHNRESDIPKIMPATITSDRLSEVVRLKKA